MSALFLPFRRTLERTEKLNAAFADFLTVFRQTLNEVSGRLFLHFLAQLLDVRPAVLLKASHNLFAIQFAFLAAGRFVTAAALRLVEEFVEIEARHLLFFGDSSCFLLVSCPFLGYLELSERSPRYQPHETQSL